MVPSVGAGPRRPVGVRMERGASAGKRLRALRPLSGAESGRRRAGGRPSPTALLRCAPVTSTGTGSLPVVLIAEELAPSVLDVLGKDVEIRHVDGADRSALLPALADAAAVMIRSATQVD